MSVVLECEVSKLEIKITWFKDEKDIKSKKKRGIIIKTDGRKHSITIHTALSADTEEYSVKVGCKQTEYKLTEEGNTELCDKYLN